MYPNTWIGFLPVIASAVMASYERDQLNHPAPIGFLAIDTPQ
jgi:hypothetical protein